MSIIQNTPGTRECQGRQGPLQGDRGISPHLIFYSRLASLSHLRRIEACHGHTATGHIYARMHSALCTAPCPVQSPNAPPAFRIASLPAGGTRCRRSPQRDRLCAARRSQRFESLHQLRKLTRAHIECRAHLTRATSGSLLAHNRYHFWVVRVAICRPTRASLTLLVPPMSSIRGFRDLIFSGWFCLAGR